MEFDILGYLLFGARCCQAKVGTADDNSMGNAQGSDQRASPARASEPVVGDSVSRSSSDTTTEAKSALSSEADGASEIVTYHRSKDDPNRPQGGMPLVHYVCRKKKRAYEKCVSGWYSKEFMTGAGSLNQEEVCGEKFEAYKTCVLKGIRKEIWDKQGLPPPMEDSPLGQIVDDEETAER